MDDNVPQTVPRHDVDEKFLSQSSCLYFTPLKEPGWLDSSVPFSALIAKLAASRQKGLRSILKHDPSSRLSRMESSLISYDFPPTEEHTRNVYIKFSEEVETTTFEVAHHIASSWKHVNTIAPQRLKRLDSSNKLGYTGEPISLSLIHISEPTRPERIGGGGVWV